MTPPESFRRDGSCRIAVRQRWSSGLAALVEHGGSHAPPERRHAASVADPIYGKFARKTNAISHFGCARMKLKPGLNPTASKEGSTDRDWPTPGCRVSSASDDFAADMPG